MSSKFHKLRQKAQWSASGIRVSQAYLHKVRRPLLLTFQIVACPLNEMHLELCVAPCHASTCAHAVGVHH